jgi:AAA15 family ATPase/GTPase
MQNLTIQNLGPIHELNVDIDKVNLLIGEQATGKSTISKCVYFFKNIKNVILEDIYAKIISSEEGKPIPKSLNAPLKEIFIKLFGFSWDLNEALYLKYVFEDSLFIEVKLNIGDRGKKYIGIYFSPVLLEKIKYAEKRFITQYLSSTSDAALPFSFINSERARLHSEILTAINDIFNDGMETYYIPAGRNILTLMFNQKTKIDYNAMDLVNRNFMRFIESIQSKFDMGIKQVHKYFPVDERGFDVVKHVHTITSCLKGDYHYNKGEEYLSLNDGTKVKINFASSGQQELLWLLLQLYILLLKDERAFVIIEEPEAHLYPSVQKYIFDYIVHFANLNNSGVLVTTHSPYILMSANTLYKAGALHVTGKKEQVNKLLGKNNYIHPDSFTAIKLSASGRYDDLVDKQSRELQISLIDEISDEINTVYSELFYLEDGYDGSK